MNRLTLDEVHKLEFDILKDIAGFCDKNGLRYYLCGGTLLGAIRHKGFIPWDDDIDIIMPRPDYEVFEKTFNSRSDSIYRMSSLNSGTNYINTFAKVYDSRTVLKMNRPDSPASPTSIYIDVFPMDGLPEGTKKSKIFILWQRILFFIAVGQYMKMTKAGNITNTLFKFPIVLISRIISIFVKSNRIFSLIEKNSKKYKFEGSKYIAVHVTVYGNKEIIPYETFVPQITVEFEGEHFKTTAGYDKYLTNLYGDYMKLPPIEKRKSHHDFEAYWSE